MLERTIFPSTIIAADVSSQDDSIASKVTDITSILLDKLIFTTRYCDCAFLSILLYYEVLGFKLKPYWG